MSFTNGQTLLCSYLKVNPFGDGGRYSQQFILLSGYGVLERVNLAMRGQGRLVEFARVYLT